MRTNLQKFPRTTAGQAVVALASDSVGWGGATASLSRVADPSAPSGGGYVTRLTHAAAATTGAGWLWYAQTSDRPAATGGQSYALSVWVRPSFPVQARIVATWKTSDNASTVRTDQGPLVSLPAGAWTRVGAVFTAPTGAASVVMALDVAAGAAYPAGATVDSDAALTEQADTVGDWFCGASHAVRRGDGYQKEHAWIGAVDASASTESDWVPGPFSVTADGTNPPRVVAQSGAAVPSGAAWQVTGSDGSSSWPVRGGAGVWAGEQVAMLDPMCPVGVPVTYTLRARTSAGAVTTLSAGPVVRVSPSSMTVTSLDGRRMVRVRVLGSDEQAGQARVQRFDIPGARRPVLRLDTVSDATEGTLEWASTGSDTAMLSTLMGENMPLICLHDPSVCQIPDCDIPPVRLLMPLSWRHQRAGRIDTAERRWQVPWLEVDDPTPDQRVMPSTWDELDAVGLTWDELDALGLTWDEFDLMAWATYTPGA